jgi:hypothetical protein
LPGIFIIDAKWQKKAGSCEVDTDKFPDMRGFIDLCHKRGIRVMLWHNSWDPEGLSAEECCLINGNPVAADPTNPVYQRRVCQYMERLFSDAPGCLNADGLKVDGMTNTPHGRTLENYSGIYGFEFARVFLTLLHREMKRVKPDALLGQFTGFPYFGDLCDIARTGDLYTIKGDPNTANAFRVAIQKIAMPGVPIETDGALRFNYLLDNEEILLTQKSLGIPCLYQCENLIQRRDFCSTQITDFDDSLWGHV